MNKSKREEYLKMLSENDKTLKCYAIDKLMKYIDDPEVYKKVIQCFSHQNVKVRLRSVLAFSMSEEKKSMLQLISLLHTETDEYVKSAIYKAIGNFKDLKTIPILSQGLNNSNNRIRANCIEALGKFKDTTNNNLFNAFSSDSSPRVRANVFKALWENEDYLIEEKIEENLYSDDPKFRTSFCYILGEITLKNEINLLVQCLKDKNNNVRKMAIRSLGKKKNITVLKHLINMLQYEKDEVVINEIKNSLLKVHPLKSMEILSKRIKECENVYEKATYIKVIGFLRCEEGMSIITHHLNDKDARIRANSIEALMYYKDSFLVNIILPFLKDANARVRANAASVLWKFGVLHSLTTLKKMLLDDNDESRKSAAYALSRI